MLAKSKVSAEVVIPFCASCERLTSLKRRLQKRLGSMIGLGNVDIAIAQHPAEIGYFGVLTAYAHLAGQSVPPLIGTVFTVIDKTNIDDPNVKRYIYSD